MSTKKNSESTTASWVRTPEGELTPEGGWTKRETIAMAALQGYLASGRKFTVENSREITLYQAAVRDADLLLKELEK